MENLHKTNRERAGDKADQAIRKMIRKDQQRRAALINDAVIQANKLAIMFNDLRIGQKKAIQDQESLFDSYHHNEKTVIECKGKMIL